MENDEILALTAPNDKYKDALKEYCEEFAEYGESYSAGPVYSGPSQTFLYIRESDDRIIGMANIREDGSEYGNIGYAIRPTERGKGYGTLIVDSLVSLCDFFGMSDILAFVYETNVASIAALKGKEFALVSDKEDESGKILVFKKSLPVGDNDDK